MRSIAAGGSGRSRNNDSSFVYLSRPEQAPGRARAAGAGNRRLKNASDYIDGKVIQPQRELAILKKTGVLVVGGGPAGTAAALSARRLGVDVTLVERYGYLGGLATGGLVLAIFPFMAEITVRSSLASAKN